ncbi:MAG: aminoacyl-tRNA hydrolase [Planctomycetia bacterium]|nr:aminoacyl-tRNA hydrolase [Planctomycetia bacterium]
MKLVVGLGNPGRKYEGTRHNVGFAILAILARQWGAGKPCKQFDGESAEAEMHGQRVLLLAPQTFMNRSGASVQKARDFYKLEISDLLVICDDFNLPLARLRFRAQGSAGGQKGMEDVIRCLGSEEFARLRIGIGPVPQPIDPADFVLGKLTRQEQAILEPAIELAAEAVGVWVRDGIETCMNRYNAGAKEKPPAENKPVEKKTADKPQERPETD